VLCDIGLPGMSGYELAKRIRERVTNGIRLIAVSGYAQPDDIKKAIDAGFDAHIAKPADPAVIDRLLS
jgi:CheY-like chemotaxis protein